MADTKITGLLTPQVTTNPATDVLPIVNIADTLMAASGSTRKITVNQLLGAGGTATLASATITGDLTVDTNVLKVDTSLNRVGIGTASPSQPLDIIGGFKSSGFWILDGTPFGAGGSVRYISGANTSNSFYQNCPTGGSHLWAFNESLAMTLNSTGLGVGDAPAANARLTIGSTNATGFQYALRTTGITTGRSQIYLANTSGDFVAGLEGSVAGATITGSAAYSAYIGTATSNPFYLVTGGSVRATVDTTGNVGIGVASPSSKLHVDAGSSSEYFRGAGNSGAARALVISASTTTNAGDTHTLNASSVSGVLAFSTNAIERMRLDASGNLILLSSNTPATLTTNGQLTVNATSNTNLRFSYRGSDGVTRTANLTLA